MNERLERQLRQIAEENNYSGEHLHCLLLGARLALKLGPLAGLWRLTIKKASSIIESEGYIATGIVLMKGADKCVVNMDRVTWHPGAQGASEIAPAIACEVCGSLEDVRACPVMTGVPFSAPADQQRFICIECIRAWYQGAETKEAILKSREAKRCAPVDPAEDSRAMREARHRMTEAQGWGREKATAFFDGWTACAYHYGIRQGGMIDQGDRQQTPPTNDKGNA